MTDLLDMRIGQYHLTEVIGRGGMSTVYKAYQPALDRFVAVKVLLHNSDPQFAARFRREARAIAHLQHPNILPIYDYNEQDGLLYLVLQYIENGATLSELLGTPMAPVAALRLAVHLLAALDYAHTRGVIHRDIKPSNVLMLSPRWPMLADFGIAKLMTDEQRLTMSGMIIGTTAYMAPEQAAGRPTDARTDLYSAGIVLYELLTGRVPFDADTPVAVLMKHAYEPPPPPSSINPDIPVAVETALLRAIEKDPGARYQSAAAMAEALEQLAIQIERGTDRDSRADLYQAGAQAFRAGRWDAAIDQLSRVVALDPTYEDAQKLLEHAQTARAYSQQEALRHAADGSTQFEREPVAEPIASAQCPHCGRAVQPDWTVCPYCRSSLGKAIAQTPVKADPAPAPSAGLVPSLKRRRSIWAALLMILVLLGGGALIARGGGRGVPTPIPTTIATAPVVVIAGKTPSATAAPSLTVTSAPSATSAPSPTVTPAPSDTSAPTHTPLADAVVNIPQLNLRAGPDTQFQLLGQYTQGTVVQVIGKEPTGKWLQVRMPDQRVGWMSAANLQINRAAADIPLVDTPRLPTSSPTPRLRPTALPRPTLAPASPTPVPALPTLAPPTPAPPTATPTNNSDNGPRPTRKPKPTPRP